MSNWLLCLMYECEAWQELLRKISSQDNTSCAAGRPSVTARARMLEGLSYFPKVREIAELTLDYESTANRASLRRTEDIWFYIAKNCADLDSYLSAVGMPGEHILRASNLMMMFPLRAAFAANLNGVRNETASSSEDVKRRARLVETTLGEFVQIFSAGISRDKDKLRAFCHSKPRSPISIAITNAPERAYTACSLIGRGKNRSQAFEIVSICEGVDLESVRSAFYKKRRSGVSRPTEPA